MSTHINSTETFRKLFTYGETIKGIDENIEELYKLATTPEGKEVIVDDTARLMETRNNLLKRQAHLVAFMSALDPLEVKVLKLRCEKNMTWKEIASELHVSDTTAKKTLTGIAEKAEKYGGIF